MDLIGRQAELDLVSERLRQRRLVTLIGPGGIGKTALARAAVARSQADFAEGSRVIDLTKVESTAGVRESLAGQLGYQSFPALLDSPGDHPVLILVDNCEHVVDAVAEAVDQMLEACQMPTFLATSRASLELPDETVVPIGPLGLPPSGTLDAPAVRLFVDRARDAGIDLEATDSIAELCRRLDGVPLAIELAAARTRAMAPPEILDRLIAGLGVLDRPRRRGARRHQSLRAAIGWSYDLLEPAERELFERLGIFAGPFSAQLAHAVAGRPADSAADTQDLLDGLVSASMVVADPSGDTTWYRELDTLRAYALDRLDDSGDRLAVEARFVDHVVERVAEVVDQGAATWSASALSELLALYGNVAAAIRWCLDHDDKPERAGLLAAALWGLVHQSHTEEIGGLAEQVLERWPDDDHVFRPDTIATAATCRYMLGDDAGALAMAEAALPHAGGSPFAPVTLRRVLAQSNRATGRPEIALRWFAEAAAEARRLNLPALAVEADTARAQVFADLGRLDDALELVGSAHDEASATGSELGRAWARSVEGSILLRVDVGRARATITEAQAASHQLSHAAGVSVNLRSLALADLCDDDIQAAACHTLELLDELLMRGSTYELRLVCEMASLILARADRLGPAADLAATAVSLPVVSITASVGHELFPLDPTGGSVLSGRDAIVVTRRELGTLVAPTDDRARARERSSDPDRIEAPIDGTARTGHLHRNGDVWEIGFGDQTTTAKLSKGLTDLARLLASPGNEIHCLELIGSGLDQGDTGPTIDDAARRAYEERVRELQADIDDAEADHDPARAERARHDLDILVDHLTAAMGLGGRGRPTGSAAERARSTVTRRVRSTIRRLESDHPRLGRHLQASVRTGTFCSYEPEHPVTWDIEA